jgi:hypothetical protein
MRASSVVWEITIVLSDEEIKFLGTNTLSGKLKARGRDQNLGEKSLELKVGEIDSKQINAILSTSPPGLYVDRVEHYSITLSKEGYESLQTRGITGDRMAANSGCKVEIYSESYERKEIRNLC